MDRILLRLAVGGVLLSGSLLQAQLSTSVSTYLGGSRSDTVTALAVDSAGLIYIAGWTESTNLPAVNARQATSKGGVDAFVAKLSADGRTVLYWTYLGGTSDDRAFAIAVDPLGNAYVTGWTTSSDFPTTTGALQTRSNGGKDAFIVKLGCTGTLLLSTYLGGSGYDYGKAIAVDTQQNIYVAGETDSTSFPLKNPIQAQSGGGTDAFAVKLAASGCALVYSTYLGGYLGDTANAVALGIDGSLYVAGGTESPDFPVLNAFQAAKRADGLDGFILKINASGTARVYSSFLGGSRGLPETVTAMAIDGSGAAYVTGVTGSSDFPTANALQSSLKGGLDLFVSKVSTTGTSLAYSTYLGGSSLDYATSIQVDANGRAWIGGYTASTDFPNLASGQTHRGGVYDGIVVLLEATGTQCSTWMVGGGGSDVVNALAVRGTSVYVGGQTNSTTMASSAIQARLGGALDGYLSVLSQPATMALAISSPTSATTYSTTSSSVTISGTASASLGVSQVSWRSDRGVSGTATGTTSWSITATTPAGTTTVTITARDTAGNAMTRTLVVINTTPTATVNPPAGSGTNKLFTATVTLPGGVGAFTELAMLLQGGGTGVPPFCQTSYRTTNNSFYLWDDGSARWLGPAAAGSGTVLQNNQCSLNAASSSGSVTATSVTAFFSVTFKPAFAGSKTIFLYTPSGWAVAGTFTVTTP